MKQCSLVKRICCWLLAASLVLGLAPVLAPSADAANWNMTYFLRKYADPHFNLQSNPNGYMTVEEFLAIVYAYSYYGDGSGNTPAADKNGRQPSAWCARYVQAEVDKKTVTPSKISWTDPVTLAFAAQFLCRAKGKYSYDAVNLYSFTGTAGLTPDDILYLSAAVDYGLIAYTPGMNVSAKIARKDALKYEIPTGAVSARAALAADTNHMKQTHAYYVADVFDTADQLENLRQSGDDITMVTVGCGYLQNGGQVSFDWKKQDTQKVLDYSLETGKIALLGIINYASGGFSNDAVASLLASDSTMDAFVFQVVAQVEEKGFDGVNMGIEVTSSGNGMRGAYGRLLTKLSQALHQKGKVLLTTVGAYFTDAQEASSFYDYKTINQASDYIHVILYDDFPDNSYPWRKTAGTMSNIIRIGRVLRYCATAMDADKLLLGMGSFAIDYDLTALRAEDISYEEAMRRQSANSGTLLTDPAEDGAHVSYVSGSNQHSIYFESVSGTKNRALMANRYGLGGTSVYYLGSGYPQMLDAISSVSSFKPEIVSALEAGLVPLSLRSRYSRAITRGEFCRLIVSFLEASSGKTIGEYLKSRSVSLDAAAFTDTQDEAVLAASALGIVNGYGKGLFRPNQTITRQEAATMLCRLASQVGMTEANGSQVSFSDIAGVPAWYLDGVKMISATEDPVTGKRVMGGVGGGRFQPTGQYTREQSIMTLIRLFHAVK